MRRFRITVGGATYDVAVEEVEEAPPAAPRVASAPPADGASASARVAPPAASPPVASTGAAGANDVASPLSGTVVEIHVAEGWDVRRGEKLVTLEAMKMNTAVPAPRDGKVESVKVRVGAPVQERQILLTLL